MLDSGRHWVSLRQIPCWVQSLQCFGVVGWVTEGFPASKNHVHLFQRFPPGTAAGRIKKRKGSRLTRFHVENTELLPVLYCLGVASEVARFCEPSSICSVTR